MLKRDYRQTARSIRALHLLYGEHWWQDRSQPHQPKHIFKLGLVLRFLNQLWNGKLSNPDHQPT